MFSRLISLLKCQSTDYEKELQHNAESSFIHCSPCAIIIINKVDLSYFFPIFCHNYELKLKSKNLL